jgi:hypothetical protein
MFDHYSLLTICIYICMCAELIIAIFITVAIFDKKHYITRRRMARERRGAGSSLVSMETQFYKQYMKDVL